MKAFGLNTSRDRAEKWMLLVIIDQKMEKYRSVDEQMDLEHRENNLQAFSFRLKESEIRKREFQHHSNLIGRSLSTNALPRMH